jgi:hypothetical protein
MSENDMPDEIKRFMKFFESFNHQHNQGTWVNVAKLSPEDTLKKKNLDMTNRRLWSEYKVFMSKIQLTQATLQANNMEFWDSIYKAYNLPSDLQYKIDNEGQVIKHVPAPPAENA